MLTTQPLLSESHLTDVNVDESFAAAVKLIEQKQYVDAVSVFKILAEQEFQRLSIIYHCFFLMGWGPQRTFDRLSFGPGRHI
jgi:hypothetical protein